MINYGSFTDSADWTVYGTLDSVNLNGLASRN
jgi:hypothetical protein